ncbi:unnamed protein product, partial [Gulo gulo]
MLSALRHGAAGMSRSLQGQAVLVPRDAIPSVPGPLPVRSRGPGGGWKQAPALRRGESGLRHQPPEPFSSQRPHIFTALRPIWRPSHHPPPERFLFSHEGLWVPSRYRETPAPKRSPWGEVPGPWPLSTAGAAGWARPPQASLPGEAEPTL